MAEGDTLPLHVVILMSRYVNLPRVPDLHGNPGNVLLWPVVLLHSSALAEFPRLGNGNTVLKSDIQIRAAIGSQSTQLGHSTQPTKASLGAVSTQANPVPCCSRQFSLM